MRQEIVAVLVAGLVVAALAAGSLAAGRETSGVATSVPPTTSVAGLTLGVNVSSEKLGAGEPLGVTVALFNGLPTPKNLTAPYNSSSWAIDGLPVAMWGTCDGVQPVDFMIVKGNYTLGQLQAAASTNSSSPGFICLEGGSVEYISFLPMSSNATVSGFYCTLGCQPDRWSADMRVTFSVSGYWAYPINGSEADDAFTPVVNAGATSTHAGFAPTAQQAFTPGWYTLVVSDGWGQTALLYFSVD